MFSSDSDLSDFFSELGQVMLPKQQYHLMMSLLDFREHVTCQVLPNVVSPQGGDVDLFNFDIPCSVVELGVANMHVFGDAYALDYCTLRDVKDDDWNGAHPIFKDIIQRENFRAYHNLSPDSLISIVRLNPLSFFVGRVQEDGIAEIIPPLKLQMH